MANPLLAVLRKPLNMNLLIRPHTFAVACTYLPDVRTLYTKASLGVDGFEQQRERTRLQLTNIVDKFREKMNEYIISETKPMIFTEDLKNMVHLADTDQDFELVIEMMKRYNSQNKALRFGNYVFGPVVMRMFYLHNKPELAYQCFKSPELEGMFDQQVTYQLVLDLLYENKMYKEMLELVDLIIDKQLEGQTYPKHVMVLAMAACYKLNNAESFERAGKLWQKLREVGHEPMRRAVTFCAALALNQGKPEIALEILSNSRNQNYTTVRNLRVATLIELGRIDEVIPILKAVLSTDLPSDDVRLHTFNRDVIDRVKKSINELNDPEFNLDFNRIEDLLTKSGQIIDKTLSEQLEMEIQKPALTGYRHEQIENQRSGQNIYSRNFDRQNSRRDRLVPPVHRPGLTDMV